MRRNLLRNSMSAAGMIAMGGMTAAERAKGRFMRDGTGHPSGSAALATMLEQHTHAIEQKLGGLGLDEIKSRLADMEQRATRPAGASGPPETKTYGQQVSDSEEFKHLKEGRFRAGLGARIELKAINSSNGSGGGINWSGRDTEIAGLSKRSFRIRDLLNVVPTESGSIDYAKQTLRTNNAAPVAEGTVKPYSAYGWTKTNSPVRTIAHLSKLTRQAADDATQLIGEVDTEMRYGLGLAEDAQLLFGDGTGENLTGLAVQATAYAKPDGFTLPSGPNLIDKLGAAILQQALTDFAPDGIVLHPTDWMTMRMLKDANGKYLFGDPGADVEPRLFGLPIAVTQAQVVGNFLLGAFKLQKLYDRMAPEVLISTENADDFEKNLMTMRCEERVALAIRQPGSIIKGAFASIT